MRHPALLLLLALSAGLLASPARGQTAAIDVACDSPYGCGSVAVAYSEVSQSESINNGVVTMSRTATCLCANGTRITIRAVFDSAGNYVGPESSVKPDEPLVAPGCPEGTMWSQGAMIAADCDIDDGAVCTSECRAAIKPFTAECLTNILTNSFFPSFNDAKPDGKAVAAFVEACAGKSAASAVTAGWAVAALALAAVALLA